MFHRLWSHMSNPCCDKKKCLKNPSTHPLLCLFCATSGSTSRFINWEMLNKYHKIKTMLYKDIWTDNNINIIKIVKNMLYMDITTKSFILFISIWTCLSKLNTRINWPLVDKTGKMYVIFEGGPILIIFWTYFNKIKESCKSKNKVLIFISFISSWLAMKHHLGKNLSFNRNTK